MITEYQKAYYYTNSFESAKNQMRFVLRQALLYRQSELRPIRMKLNVVNDHYLRDNTQKVYIYLRLQP